MPVSEAGTTRAPSPICQKRALLEVMNHVLQLHEDGQVKPASRFEPTAKSVRLPADIPPMKQMISKRDEKCIHCHDVKSGGSHPSAQHAGLGQATRIYLSFAQQSGHSNQSKPSARDRTSRSRLGGRQSRTAIRRQDRHFGGPTNDLLRRRHSSFGADARER